MPVELGPRFRRQRLVSPKRFDPRSFRTVKVGRHAVVVGCPRGSYDARREKCKVGTEAQSLLHPRRENPGRDTKKILRAAKRLHIIGRR